VSKTLCTQKTIKLDSGTFHESFIYLNTMLHVIQIILKQPLAYTFTDFQEK